MNELNKELSVIQKTLKAPKGQTNTFGNYKYRSCEDIVEAIKPLLGDNTLLITDEMVNLGERYYIKATAIFSNGKETISVCGYAREDLLKKGMDVAQITGSASSYARKYALNGLFAIDDTKDADSTNMHGKDAENATQATKEASIEGRPDYPVNDIDPNDIPFN